MVIPCYLNSITKCKKESNFTSRVSMEIDTKWNLESVEDIERVL